VVFELELLVVIQCIYPRTHSHSKQLAYPQPRSFPSIQCRSYIEVKAEVARCGRVGSGLDARGRSTGVEIDHVTDLLAASVDHPVVAVEWSRVAVATKKDTMSV
jgi:hypothetical protein